MSKIAHTPGPWSIPGQPDKICAEGFTRNGAAKAIATAHTPSWMAGSEPWANAHLIAAAPTMADYVKRKADDGCEEAASIWEQINAR